MAGLFGNTQPAYQSALMMGDGAPIAMPAQQDLGPVQQVQAPKAKKGGLFGSGIRWDQIAGTIGDALMAVNGQPMQYAPMMAEQRQREFLLKRQEQNRQNDFTDWQRKQEYTAAHPAPVNNDTVNDFNWYKNLSPEDRATYSQMHPQYQTVHNPDGTVTVYPMGGGTAPQAAQPQVLGSTLPQGWSVQGGSGGNVTGGFR